MKLILSGALAFGLLGSAGFATIDDTGPPGSDGPRAAATRVVPAPTIFRVWSGGRETACTLSKTAARPDGPAAVTPSPQCGDLPVLAGVARWRVLRDETVALVDGDGRVRLEFARSDGVAYETFRPNAPLMAMIAVN